MPRGVYDRSKTKEQRAAEKAAAAAKAAGTGKVKGKPGRKPGQKVAAPVVTESTKSASALELFATIRANIETLKHLGETFRDIPAIKSEVAAHVEVMANLRKQVFGSGEEKTEQIAEATPAPAPVQQNGAVTAPQYQQPPTVPMPPAPIPSIPAAH